MRFSVAAVVVATVVLAAPASPALASSTMFVDSNADSNSRDAVLTLREAVLLATGDLATGSLTAAELDNVSGAPGAAEPDEIFFDGAVSTITTSGLPPLDTGNDTIYGPGSAVKIAGSGFVDCITLSSSGNRISGLQVGGGCSHGIIVVSGTGNLLDGNTIFDNSSAGIFVKSPATDTLIIGNKIGTDASGTMVNPAGGNSSGIYITGAGNIIGSTSPSGRNVISGNSYGVFMDFPSSTGNLVIGNYIGTDAAGTADLGNGSIGVWAADGAANNTIGGTGPGEGNLISGNSAQNVVIEGGGTGNVVAGNIIGPDKNGSGAAMTNSFYGVLLTNTSGNTVGPRNVISDSGIVGVALGGSSTQNVIKGNFIGTDMTGTSGVPNVIVGIRILNDSRFNVIGGTAPGDGNVIAFNGFSGVEVIGSDAIGNAIRGNSIHSHSGTGIAVGGGANHSISPPTIAGGSGSELTGTACPNCVVDVFSDSGDEGQHYLGSAMASLGGVFSVALAPPPAANLTATATNAGGDSSAFSAPFAAELCDGVDNDGDGFYDEGYADGDADGRKDCVDSGQTCFDPAGTLSCPTQDCRSLAEDIDAFKDSDGCPEPDNDNDGFPDATDDCPGTGTHAGPDGMLGSPQDLNHNGIKDSSESPLSTDDVVLTFEDYDTVLNGDGCHDSPGQDFDADGYTDDTEEGSILCNGVDNDVFDDSVIDDGCPGGPAQVGAFSEAQFQIGTKAFDPCGQDAWPSDLVSTGFSANRFDTVDLASFVAPVRRIDKNPGEAAFDSRWDLAPGNSGFGKFINIADLAATISGAKGFPPMLGGQKALNQTCPIAP